MAAIYLFSILGSYVGYRNEDTLWNGSQIVPDQTPEWMNLLAAFYQMRRFSLPQHMKVRTGMIYCRNVHTYPSNSTMLNSQQKSSTTWNVGRWPKTEMATAKPEIVIPDCHVILSQFQRLFPYIRLYPTHRTKLRHWHYDYLLLQFTNLRLYLRFYTVAISVSGHRPTLRNVEVLSSELDMVEYAGSMIHLPHSKIFLFALYWVFLRCSKPEKVISCNFYNWLLSDIKRSYYLPLWAYPEMCRKLQNVVKSLLVSFTNITVLLAFEGFSVTVNIRKLQTSRVFK
jgi:hypothetical protein